MKTRLRKLLAPVLTPLESGEGEYRYKSSHRKILLAVGTLFMVLSVVSAVAAYYAQQAGAWLPFLVFFGVGSVCVIVGSLGSDRAVAKLWGNR